MTKNLDSSPKCILAVDDDPNVLKMLSLLLGREGFVVKCASDGVEGLRQFRLRSWDAVITDRSMPILDGEDMADQMRQEREDVPIIMLTGAPGRLRNAGRFEVVLAKPFTLPDLLNGLSRLFPGKPLLAAPVNEQ